MHWLLARPRSSLLCSQRQCTLAGRTPEGTSWGGMGTKADLGGLRQVTQMPPSGREN